MKKNHDIGKYDSFADKYAAEVDQRPFHIYYERPGTWSLLPKQLKGLNVLDIGCGSGWYAEHLIKSGCQVTAMDLNAHMVEVTQKRLQKSGKVIQADLQKPLDFFPSESFDMVIAPLVIHYLNDLKAPMKEIARVTKSKGLFIFSVSQPQSEFYLHNLSNYFEKQIITDHWPWVNADVQHFHYTLEDYVESLYEAGFLVERMLEPLPQEGLKEESHLYQLITTKPWFLFVRALKR
jgi:ubiquinone/menaquinone biosynthesis C-methylase UbiE